MFTQEEMREMSYRRMKYHRVMFYETPEGNLHAISNTREGFQTLSFKTGAHPDAGIKIVEVKNKEQQIEDSPYLQIAEAKV